jgi:NADH oxidase (H2O2-forming)
MMEVVIIGGGSAGTSCAIELRKRSKDIAITILEQSGYREYSPCALPYVLSGEIPSFDDIFIFTDEDYEHNAIRLVRDTLVERIERDEKQVRAVTDGTQSTYGYDVLIIATGSEPLIPFPVVGAYHTLRTLDDAKKLEPELRPGQRLAVVGGGLIGLEAAHAGTARGMDVHIIEAHERILANIFDADMEKRIRTALDLNITSGAKITRATKGLLEFDDREPVPYDVLLIATGLTSDVSLARDSEIDIESGITVDTEYKTSDPSIYAVGDCCALEHRFEGSKPIMLGTLAFQAAPLIASSILKEPVEEHTNVGASISRIANHTFASTGLTLERARALGIEATGSLIEGNTRSEYYPGSYPMSVKLVARNDGVLIGGQILGREDVAGRTNLVTFAVTHEMTIDDLARLETVYNPATAPIHEPITIAASMLRKKIDAQRKR